MALVLLHIGMMKAGSTWLNHWLRAHPELEAPWPTPGDAGSPGKNPYWWVRNHPFGRSARNMQKWPDLPIASSWHYRRMADSAPKTFDSTDSASMLRTWEISAFRSQYPATLVAYIRRDPIEAMWSHMRMHAVHTTQHLDPRMVCNALSERNLERWARQGGPMVVYDFEDVRSDPLSVLRDLGERLEIDSSWWNVYKDELRQPINSAAGERSSMAEITPKVRAELEALLELVA